jgi:succinoglycan biosynthesis transport protein ExoP
MRPITPEDYSEIWNRRKWWFVGAVFVIAAGTAIVAAMLPRSYTSECLILLEGQPLPSDANATQGSKPGGDTQTEQQLSTLIEQTLSRTRLEQIMHDSGYISPTDTPSDSTFDNFRDAINVEILKDKDPRRITPPYGFKISYSDHKPKNAQRITNELASFFVSERMKSKEQTEQESNQYLQSELESALKDVKEKEQALTDFKQRYTGQLPVDEQLNVQSLVRLQAQLEMNQQSVARANEEETSGENTAQAGTSAAKSPADSATAKLSADLGALKSKLADLLSRDKENHPDVIKTRAEIARVETELASEQQVAAKTSDPASKSEGANVSASTLKRLQDARATIDARLKEQDRIKDEINRYQTNLQQIPIHAQQFGELERTYNDSKTTFDALKKKVDDAQLDNDMQIRLQGQRFSIQDFASLPDTPTSPVYWKINLGGLGAALLFGVVLAGAVEFGDTTMKSDRDVEYYLQTKNLAMVPVLPMPAESLRARRKKRLWAISSVPVVLLIAGIVGYLYFIRK